MSEIQSATVNPKSLQELQLEFIKLRGTMAECHQTLLNTKSMIKSKKAKENTQNLPVLEILQSQDMLNETTMDQIIKDSFLKQEDDFYTIVRSTRNSIMKQLLVFNHLLDKGVLKGGIHEGEYVYPIHISADDDKAIADVFSTINGIEPYFTVQDILALYKPLYEHGIVLASMEQIKTLEKQFTEEDKIYQPYYRQKILLCQKFIPWTEECYAKFRQSKLSECLEQFKELDTCVKEFKELALSEMSQSILQVNINRIQTLTEEIQDFTKRLANTDVQKMCKDIKELRHRIQLEGNELSKQYMRKVHSSMDNLQGKTRCLQDNMMIYGTLCTTDLPQWIVYDHALVSGTPTSMP